MHVSLQILSPAAARAYGVHENWSGNKGDILWRERLKGNSSASLPPKLTFDSGDKKAGGGTKPQLLFARSSAPSVGHLRQDLLMDSVHANLLDDTANMRSNAGSEIPSYPPKRTFKVKIQRSAKVNAPGCVNAAGKLVRNDKKQ